MSRTDKTDPYRVKVERYGAHYWMPWFSCGCRGCAWCKPMSTPEGRRQRRDESKRQAREWQREYDDA